MIDREASILHSINADFGAVASARGDCQIKAVEALPLFSVIPGGLRADGGGDFVEGFIVIRIDHLQNLDVALAARNVNPLAGGVEVQIVAVLRTGKLGHYAAGDGVDNRHAGRRMDADEQTVISFVESHGEIACLLYT